MPCQLQATLRVTPAAMLQNHTRSTFSRYKTLIKDGQIFPVDTLSEPAKELEA
jgi:hypothetical protein